MKLRKPIALAVTLTVLIVGFFWPVRGRADAALWSHLLDASHIPLLGWLAAVLFYTLPEGTQPALRRHAFAFGLATGFALAVELLQPLADRSQSGRDFLNGTIGAALALSGIGAWQPARQWFWRCGHSFAVVAAVSFALWPAYEERRGQRWRAQHFPALGNFESDEELRLWRPQGGSLAQPTQISRTRAQAVEGEQSLRVVGGVGDWAGVTYTAADQDWTPFSTLKLAIFNPHEPFTLFVRVDDHGLDQSRSGRFEREFTLVQGWNRLRIPLAEIERNAPHQRLNLKAIRRVAVFTGEGQPPRIWLLDNVALELREEGTK